MEYAQDASNRASFPANIVSKARPVIGRQCIYILSNYGVIPLHVSTRVRLERIELNQIRIRQTKAAG